MVSCGNDQSRRHGARGILYRTLPGKKHHIPGASVSESSDSSDDTSSDDDGPSVITSARIVGGAKPWAVPIRKTDSAKRAESPKKICLPPLKIERTSPSEFILSGDKAPSGTSTTGSTARGESIDEEHSVMGTSGRDFGLDQEEHFPSRAKPWWRHGWVVVLVVAVILFAPHPKATAARIC